MAASQYFLCVGMSVIIIYLIVTVAKSLSTIILVTGQYSLYNFTFKPFHTYRNAPNQRGFLSIPKGVLRRGSHQIGNFWNLGIPEDTYSIPKYAKRIDSYSYCNMSICILMPDLSYLLKLVLSS